MEAKDFGFQFGHIGIMNPTEAEARKSADTLADLFGFKTTEYSYAIHVADEFEILKMPGRGRLGHFSIKCNDVPAAMKYLEGKGVVFDQKTAHYTEDGKLWKIFANGDISGFDWHLVNEDLRP